MSIFDNEDFRSLAETQLNARDLYDKECDAFWEQLPYEDRLKAFYSVSKRIHQGEIKDKGSYRWVLYDVFGFGPEAYAIGMDCGYMYLHNSIVDGEADYE